ncbi:MAG: site-2 protease family protein [Planctomycetaceae bacterium]|nr:site-2 protease family protein [Planctomycetaceae bacterium]
MPTNSHELAERLLTLLPVWLSLSFHEWAHARAAWQLGDDTAALQGRLTLNPIAHIDPIGTLLLPLLGVPFGWAKPVPVNPLRFRQGINMRTGMMWTAIAGPMANLALASGCVVLWTALIYFQPLAGHAFEVAYKSLITMIFVNVILAVFNALPVPPLDGSRVADALMPAAFRPVWEGFYRLGPIALAAVILLPQALHVNLFVWPVRGVLGLLSFIARAVVG